MSALRVVAFRCVAGIASGTGLIVVGCNAPIINAKLEWLAHVGGECLTQ